MKKYFFNYDLFNYLFRILKLLNQRKLETLKERWWNQNPEKKVSSHTVADPMSNKVVNPERKIADKIHRKGDIYC